MIEIVAEETKPIEIEKGKIESKRLDGKDVIATVPNVDHLITRVANDQIDELVDRIPIEKLVPMEDQDVDKFVTKVSDSV